jgi:hypothetical protein
MSSLANTRCNLTENRVSAADFSNIVSSQKLTELAKRAKNSHLFNMSCFL